VSALVSRGYNRTALTPVGNDGLHPLNLDRSRRETPNVRRLETRRNIAHHGYEYITTTAVCVWRNRGFVGVEERDA
jgi:hypothetical protein